ncbi:flagellar motor protein [Demequina capsici]|uniref:Flagellar motor protein n=1 Tax=Demequina capsici TaxID=3075620 RepID=A0AA96FAY3_9MICO|nr:MULTISPECIES: flagellar motor protein [unclassified Demequina]WNM24560.1 flagellar motor protein [Demequina sp. OYTSA14]WNM27411.1 flagellar motor protein [Demequina sp. PMTSA13]
MDVATLIGIGAAFGAVIMAILMEGSTPMSVILPAPMMLVIGGTIGAGLATTTLKGFMGAFTSLRSYLIYKAQDPHETVDLLVSLADKARREGLLALEDATRDIDDDFIKDGLQSAIDGTDPEDLRAVMEAKIDGKKAQDKAIAKVFTDMGGFAPTIGIIGTVVSLVHVLENLADPSSIGHMIASAFVATLWGLLSANLIWLPIAARIKRISEMEAQRMEMAMEGLLAIQAGANPRSVGQRLRALAPEARKPSKEAA